MIQVSYAPSAGPLTQSINADGFSVAGGTTPRTLTVISADVALNQSLRTTDSPTFVGLTVTGGTVTVSTPLINATQTWNAAGVTFTGLKLNVTNTASATASLLLDLQVGGASKFSVSRTGFIAAVIGLQVGSTLGLDANNFYMASTGSIRWGATLYADDLFLARDAANVLAQRNGANAQTFRVYGGYTDASNYSRLAISGNRIASEVAGSGSLVVTVSTPILDLAQTWNDAGVTFTAFKVNVTDTASAAASLLADWQVGGVSQWNLTKAGKVTQLGALVLPSGTPAAPSLALGQSNQGWYSRSTKTISVGLDSGAAPIFELDANSGGIRVAANYYLGWSTTSANAGASIDTFLLRDAAAVLAQRNGTAAQAFRVYNTYTDANSWERGGLTWVSNVLQIGTSKGSGAGSTRTIAIVVGNTVLWNFEQAGHLTANSDNSVDIGASGATRPRTIYVGTSLVTPKLSMLSTGGAAAAGDATLVGGTVTVNTTAVLTATKVMLTRKTTGGTIGTAITYTIVNATSFTINSDNPLDTSTFSWFLVSVY